MSNKISKSAQLAPSSFNYKNFMLIFALDDGCERVEMSIETLNKLRRESGVHTDKALKLFEEAAEIVEDMKNAENPEDQMKLREEWLLKEAEARQEIKKSLAVYNQFIDRLEKIKNNQLN